MTEFATSERSARNESSGVPRQGRREAMHWLQERVQRLPFRLGGQEPDMPLGALVLASGELGMHAQRLPVIGDLVVLA
jgi:hypothetical protein